MREVECYNCHDFGHYARNCPQEKKAQEESNLVYEDEEPTLLMAITEEPEWTGSVIERNEVQGKEKSELESDMKKELESWKSDMLRDFEMKKQEFETELRNREIWFERQMREKEKSFTESLNKEFEKLKPERVQLEKEKKCKGSGEMSSSNVLSPDSKIVRESGCKKRKQETVRDLPSKDGTLKSKEDGVQDKGGDIQRKYEGKDCATSQEDVDQDEKQVVGRKPKFRDMKLQKHEGVEGSMEGKTGASSHEDK